MTNLMDLIADIDREAQTAHLGGAGTTAGSEASGSGMTSGFDPVGGGTDPIYGGLMQQAMSLIGQKGKGGGGGGGGGGAGGLGGAIEFGNAFDPKDDLVTRRGVTLQDSAMGSLMDLANPVTKRILGAIGGGYRDLASQQRLYQAYLSGNGNLAAKPGHSYHNYGAAFDLSKHIGNRLRQALLSAGWRNEVPGEWWHWSIGNAPWGGN